MANLLRRADIIRVLQEAGVDFDADASMGVLRPLYDQAIAARMVDHHDGQSNSDESSDDEDDGAAAREEERARVEAEERERAQVQREADERERGRRAALVIEQLQGDGGREPAPVAAASGSLANREADLLAEELLVDRQLAVMRRKRELLELQRELRDLDTRRFDFAAFEAMVCKFTGDDAYDICKWFDDLEDAHAAFNCSTRDKFVSTRRLLDGTARVFLRTIRASTYEELKEELLTEFRHTYTMQEVYQQLRARVLGKDEPVQRYVSVMIEIASRAPVPEVDIIDCIVDGLNDKSQNVMLLLNATTIAELKVAVKRYERKRRATAPVATTTVSSKAAAPPTNAVLSAALRRAATVASNAASAGAIATPSDMTTVRCYNCMKMGHYQGQCTEPKRPANSCFHCNEVGHTRNNCPKRKVNNAVAAIDDNNLDDDPEVQRLAALLCETHMVSVAFIKPNKCIVSLKCSALFDTGSPVSFIRRSLVPVEVNGAKRVTSFKGMGNKRISTYGNVTCAIGFREHALRHEFIILPDEESPVPMLVGRDLLRKMRIHLCQLANYQYSKNSLIEINKSNKGQKLNDVTTNTLVSFDLFERPSEKGIDSVAMPSGPNEVDKYACPAWVDEELIAPIGVDEISECVDKLDISPELSDHDREALKSIILNDYVYVLDMNRRFDGHCMKIRLTSDTPVHCRPRRLSYRERQEVQKTIDELLAEGVIRPSDSPYASPIVLVRKKDGTLRMCVDFRALNKVTVRDHFPLPVIEDCLEYLGGKKYFSTLDLKSGFHQVPMQDESKHITAFVTPMGQYEYNYMPFGLTNAPPVFQRFISTVLKPLIESNKISVFMDDIMVATQTMDEHQQILTELFQLLTAAGLRLNFKKCRFAYKEIEYLSYCVTENGIRPNENHLKAIRNFPVPTNTREVQSCHGLFSYFRRFVSNFSSIARPLTALIKKGAIFEWTDECMNAFEELRDKLISAPVLSIYDPSKVTELHTDASSRGFGAVLLQKQEDNKYHPVAYFSKSTSAAEAKYHSFELETLAMVYALRRFRMFLEGIKFTIVTDCNSLIMTLNKKLINPRIARWALEFENFDYDVKHRKGEQMGHADALSRQRFVGVVDGSDLDFNIQVSQTRDEKIKELRDRLEMDEVRGYELENGLVFRVRDDNRRQLYVPAEWEDNIMRTIHEKYGHLGVEKCTNQIQKYYWFPHMREKMNVFIKNCLKCIYYSSLSRSNERNLYPIEKVPKPFHTLHIDHYGPLPSLKSKRKHVLVVIDAFTKFVKLYAVNGTSSKESWCALKRYFEVYSRPVRLISDQGPGFKSEEFETYLERANIQHVSTSVASPQSNGQCERVNRVLRAILAKLTQPMDHGDWVRQLSQVEFAINNTVHSASKQTPSQVLFGVEQKGEMIDEMAEYLVENYTGTEVNVEEIRAQAQEAIQKSQTTNMMNHMRHYKPAREYAVGDLVVVKHVDTTVGVNKKLINKYRGPYVVRKRIGHDRYLISDVENCQLTQMPYENIVDSSRMKLWLANRNQTDEGNTGEVVDKQNDVGDDQLVEEVEEQVDGDVDDCTDYEYLEDD